MCSATSDGRDHFDVKQMLLGEPETEKERLEQLQAQRDYETQVSPGAAVALGGAALLGPAGMAIGLGSMYATGGAGLGTYLTGEERRILLETTAEAEQAYRDYEAAVKEFGEATRSPPAPGPPAALARGGAARRRGVHREEVDAITDKISTAAALLAGAAVILASGGTATPAVVAAAAAASGATSIATKMLLKGPNAYGWEEAASDAGMAVVDVAAALLHRRYRRGAPELRGRRRAGGNGQGRPPEPDGRALRRGGDRECARGDPIVPPGCRDERRHMAQHATRSPRACMPWA